MAQSPAYDRFQHPVTDKVVGALRAALGERLVAVIVFGSRARGDAQAASDWDMLVLADGLPERLFERHLYLKRLLPVDCRAAVSILARTPAEFESHVSSLYLDIALDGHILYDVHGYAAARLSALRRLIKEKGLYRERTENGDVWRWKTRPSGSWHLDWRL